MSNGFVFQTPVNVARGAPLFFSPQNQQYYVKTDPGRLRTAIRRQPANPLGLASYAAGTGITSGSYPEANYQKEITSSGVFLANFTSWWHDWINTLVGYRYTYTANHIPNTGVPTYRIYDTTRFRGAPSYNVGPRRPDQLLAALVHRLLRQLPSGQRRHGLLWAADRRILRTRR